MAYRHNIRTYQSSTTLDTKLTIERERSPTDTASLMRIKEQGFAVSRAAFHPSYAMSCAACSPRRAPLTSRSWGKPAAHWLSILARIKHMLAPGRLHGQQASIQAAAHYSEAKEPHREPDRRITRHTESHWPSPRGVSGHQNQH